MARIPTATEGGLGNLAAQAVQLTGPRPVFTPPSSTSPGVAGGIVGEALQNFAQAGLAAGGTMVDMATQVQIEKNERDAKNADLAYSKRVRELMFGDGTPENPGFYGLSGQNAVDAFAEAQASLGTIRDEIAGTLDNDRARQMFSDSASVRLDQEIKRATIHSFEQGKVASQDASEARVAEFRDDAVARYTDPKAREQNKQLGINEVTNFWQDQGAADETVATKVGEFTTEFHSSVIDRYLSDGDTVTAQAYFDQNIAEIDGRSHSDILDAIARKATTETSGLKRDMREHIAALNAGTMAQGLEELQAQVDAVPVGMNDAFDNLRQNLLDAISDQPIVASYMKKPPGEVGEFLATFRARMTSTDPDRRPSIDEVRRFQKIEKAHAEQAKMFADGDGLQVAANNGVVDPLEPINFSDPDSIAVRVAQAAAASEVYETDISPLLDSEIDALIDTVTGEGEPTPPSIEEVSLILNNLHEGLGEDNASFLVRDVIEKNNPAVALALQTVRERPRLSQEIISGGRFLQDPNNKEFRPPFQDKLTASSAVFGTGDNSLWTSATIAARGDIMAAADGLYASRAAAAGEPTFNADMYEKAIEDVIGGTVTHNGRKVVPPTPYMDQYDFDTVMESIQNTTLLDENGELPKLGNGEDFTADMLTSSIWRDEGQLVSNSLDGTYNILIPGVGYVLNSDGDPYELDLRRAISKLEPGTLAYSPELPGFEQPDLPPEIAVGIFDERRTARGLINDLTSALNSIPEPAAPEVGEVLPRRRPEGLDVSMSRSKGFTAAAEVSGVQTIPVKAYKDSLGNPTIGIGFNLNKPHARELIEGLGYNYDAVRRGSQEITQGDAYMLFQRDYGIAQIDARAVVPGFDNLDFARKTVLTDMAFNLGREGLAEFENMLAAIAAEDWDLAAREAKDSAWFKQVGRRGPRNVETLRTGEIKGFN